MRVITFSRVFPATHPKVGEPTYFVEKIMASLADCIKGWKMYDDFTLYDWHEYYNATPKHHTIRAGHRWKEGEWFSPRIWSGKPYASKQIEFAPPIQIKKICDIKIEGYFIWIDGKAFSQAMWHNTAIELAKNDGLSIDDFWDWFPYKAGTVFIGQIICWNESVNYYSTELPNPERSASQQEINSSNDD